MRLLCCLVLLSLFSGCVSKVVKERGREISSAELERLEAPVKVGLQLLANEVRMEVSRNYHQELALPAGGGNFNEATRDERRNEWTYRVKKGPTFRPLPFTFRKLSGLAANALIVRCPPVKEFKIRVQARGNVVLQVPGRAEALRGQELLIANGRVSLDGRMIALPLASPPAGGTR